MQGELMTTLDVSHINGPALLSGITPWPDNYALNITGLSSDSRETKPGDLFIACAGPLNERQQYIEQAIAHGAVAVLIDANTNAISPTAQKIPIIPVPDLADKTGLIAARFYGNPSAEME